MSLPGWPAKSKESKRALLPAPIASEAIELESRVTGSGNSVEIVRLDTTPDGWRPRQKQILQPVYTRVAGDSSLQDRAVSSGSAGIRSDKLRILGQSALVPWAVANE